MTWRFLSDLVPQKARGTLDPAMWDDVMYVAEVKEDGDRRIAQFCASGLVRFTGTPSKTTGKPVEKTENIPQLSGASLGGWATHPNVVRALEGTVLDGEIVAPWAADLPGGKSKYVTSIMGSSPGEAIAKQKANGFLCYVVFDCLFWKGTDLRNRPLYKRAYYVDQVLAAWKNSYASRVQRAVGVGKERFYKATVESGGEGVVLKHQMHEYGNARQWVKVKYDATADVIVMGYEDGLGKYAGQIGSIIFGQYVRTLGTRTFTLTKMGACSGIDDLLRSFITKKPEHYLGQVMEIKHYGREPTGAFRHPQFKRWRPDKRPDPKDCFYYPEES
jgi:ATP-dependent DNA ligase